MDPTAHAKVCSIKTIPLSTALPATILAKLAPTTMYVHYVTLPATVFYQDLPLSALACRAIMTMA